MDLEDYKQLLISVIKERQKMLDVSDADYIEGLIDGLELAKLLIERS